MNGDLHAHIKAAFNREQSRTYVCDCEGFGHDHGLALRRIESDRRVLARHTTPGMIWCPVERVEEWCDDVLALAARYDVEVDRA